MTGLLFAHPDWLAPGLAFLGAVAGALLWAAGRSRRSLRALLGAAASRAPGVATPHLRDASWLAALVLVLVGLLGPRIGREHVALSSPGVDLVVLLDASRSMDARDVPPSRIDAARRAATELLGGLGPADRAALAVFAGRGVLLTPLTPDHAALAEMLRSVDTSLVTPGGSDLPAGVAAALEAFEPADERPRALVVLSDGEPQGEVAPPPVEDAIVPAVRANARVLAAAFGTRQGATIPDHGVPLRDAAGHVVTTRRRLAGLEALAERTGGRLFVADEWGRLDVEVALADLRAPANAAPGEVALHPVTVAVVVPFAAAAGALLLLEWLAPGFARSPRRRARGLRGPALAAVCCISLAATAADAPTGHPSANARDLLRLGLERATRGDWAGARPRFLAAALSARDPELRAIAYHDLGVAALRGGDPEAARDAFFDALAASPGSRDPERVARTRWNLEWVLARLAGDATPPPEPRAPMPAPRAREPEPAAGAPEPAAPRQPPPAPAPGSSADPRAGGSADPGRTPPLELDERERAAWLERVSDDPRRALRSAALEPASDRRRRTLGRPTW